MGCHFADCRMLYRNLRTRILNETLVETGSENVFIKMIQQIFDGNIVLIFIGGLFLCGILAAIMSTADSQLLVCASSASKDIFKNILKPEAEDKKY